MNIRRIFIFLFFGLGVLFVLGYFLAAYRSESWLICSSLLINLALASFIGARLLSAPGRPLCDLFVIILSVSAIAVTTAEPYNLSCGLYSDKLESILPQASFIFRFFSTQLLVASLSLALGIRTLGEYELQIKQVLASILLIIFAGGFSYAFAYRLLISVSYFGMSDFVICGIQGGHIEGRFSGLYSCNTKSLDAGKVCSRGSDCQNYCVPRNKKSGYCSPYPGYSCFNYLEEYGIGSVCRD